MEEFASKQSPPAQTEETMRGHFGEFFSSLQNSLREKADLLALEARQAGISAALMLGLAVGIALLGVTTWLLLIAALIAALSHTFIGFAGALAFAAVLNIGAAIPMFFVIRASSGNLTFPATRRQLRGAPVPAPPTDVAHSEA